MIENSLGGASTQQNVILPLYRQVQYFSHVTDFPIIDSLNIVGPGLFLWNPYRLHADIVRAHNIRVRIVANKYAFIRFCIKRPQHRGKYIRIGFMFTEDAWYKVVVNKIRDSRI